MLLEYIFSSDSQKDLIPTGILMQRLGLKPDLTGMGGRYKTANGKIWFINSHLCHILKIILYLSLGKTI